MKIAYVYIISVNKDLNGYSIDFTFNKQSANVTIETNRKNPNRVRLVSNTDGYHWLQFWLSQKPNAKELLNLSFTDEIRRCKALFSPYGIAYEQEDKESAFLTLNKPIDLYTVELIAAIIEPHFANRERFF